jgi:hypothetical protein
MDRRYRRRIKKLMIGAAVALPLLIAGAATAETPTMKTHAEPIRWSNPAARAPGGTGVTPQVTRLMLGAFDAPAAGVTLQFGTPAGVPLAANDIPRSARPRTLTIVRASTAPFSAVGVTWRESTGIGTISVAVRGHTPGGDWAAWHAVGAAEPDRDADVRDKTAAAGPTGAAAAPATRGGADLAWLGPSDGVELSVTLVTGRAPHDVTADLIDPADAPGDAQPVALPAAAQPVVKTPMPDASGRPRQAPKTVTHVARPPIYPRAAWGADERMMTWRPRYAPVLKALVLHQTATGDDYGPADVPKLLRALYQYQAVSRGWGDLGYNVVVDRFGRLWEGRSGGLSRTVVGAQAGGFNAGTSGVAMLGTYTATAVPPAVIEATARYAAWKLSLGPAADPRGTVTLTGGGPNSRFTAGTSITVPRILAHRQLQPTDCPGAGGMSALPAIRTRAAQLLGDLVRPSAMRTTLAVWRPNADVYLVPGGGAPLFAGSPGDVPVPADYDGDGQTDAATWTPATATWKIRYSTDGSVQTRQFGSPADQPVPADYDGDGRAEPAIFHPATGRWSIEGVGDLVLGRAGDVPVPADYDGDGSAEAAIWRPTTGTWVMSGSNDFRLGERWHVPVPADYTGDGAADPASWSPVTQRFFVRGVGPGALGKKGDVPVPAQYDGDGRADFAVFHPMGDGRAEYQIHGIGTFTFGAVGDVPIPMR